MNESSRNYWLSLSRSFDETPSTSLFTPMLRSEVPSEATEPKDAALLSEPKPKLRVRPTNRTSPKGH